MGHGQLLARVSKGDLRGMMDCLERLMMEGIKHGFFEYSIRCEVISGGKRQVVVGAGKIYKFTVQEHEVGSLCALRPRSTGDPWDGDVWKPTVGHSPLVRIR